MVAAAGRSKRSIEVIVNPFVVVAALPIRRCFRRRTHIAVTVGDRSCSSTFCPRPRLHGACQGRQRWSGRGGPRGEQQVRGDAQRCHRTLVHAGEVLFLAVAVLVGWKLWRLVSGGEPPPWLEWLTVVLPTFAAAFVGFRAYAELELLAGQSRHMCGVMRQAEARLGALDLAQPLASQDLGAITHAVAITMLQEVDGWARMFRVKVVEAG